MGRYNLALTSPAQPIAVHASADALSPDQHQSSKDPGSPIASPPMRERERALYLIGGSALCLPTIRMAKSLGWTVFVTDRDNDAPGLGEADTGGWVDGADIEGQLDFLRMQAGFGFDIQACYCPADFGLPALRAIRRELGLPDNPPEVYDVLADKGAQLRRLRERGILTPASYGKRAWAMVSKPSKGSGGSSGVRILSLTDRQASHKASDGLLEPFVEGRHIDTNGLLHAGRLTPCGMLEKVVLPGPHPVPMAGWTLLSTEDSIAHLVLERACQALGLTEGPVKADMIQTSEAEYVVLEVEPRFHGDVTTAGCLPSIGMDPMRLLLGEGHGSPRASFAAWWVLWLPPGRLIEVPDLPQIPGVTSTWWNPKIKAGDVIQPPTSTKNVPGYLAIAGESREHVWELREAWRRELRLVMEPLGPDTRDDLEGILLEL